MQTKVPIKTIIRIAILIAWSVLFGMLLKRDYFVRTLDLKEQQALQRGREEDFMGVYFHQERIGYVKSRLVPVPDQGLQLFQYSLLNLNILDQTYPVKITIQALLAEDLLLKDFTFSLSSPFYEMKAKGEVAGATVRFTLTTGKEEIKDQIRLENPPRLATNKRDYLLRQGMQQGDRLKIPYFDPISLSGKETVVEYRGLEKVLIRGRIFNLHHFVETFSGVRINSWLNDEGKVVKEESPAGFVFIAEPEFQALDIVRKGGEILTSVAVPVAATLPEPERLKALRLRLTLPEGGVFEINKDRQSLTEDILAIHKEVLPSPEAPVCSGRTRELASTPYIQAANPVIASQTAGLIQEGFGPLAKVRIIADWVFSNIEKRPVIGIPDAITTITDRVGDCNEHAVLFAAMARSARIPTRIASGVMYTEGAFFYHAWNEVCIDERWISLDTTRNQLPADVTHVKFVEGETQEQVRIGALLGNLKIEIIDFN